MQGTKVSAILFLTALTLVILLTADYQIVRWKEAKMSQTMRRLGGKMGSLPLWPLGTEYRVFFNARLTTTQTLSLTPLNHLRGSVAVAFPACIYSPDEIDEIKRLLNRCHLFSIVAGQSLGKFASCTDIAN